MKDVNQLLTKNGESNPVKGMELKLIEAKRRLIAYILKQLSMDTELYNPKTTIDLVSNCISENERLLYSEITIIFYSKEEKEKNNIHANALELVRYAYEKNYEDEIKRFTLKVFDHIELARFQDQQLDEAVDDSKEKADSMLKKKTKDFAEQLDNAVKKEKENALKEIGNKMNDESRSAQRGYVATLGIFSAIMLASFASLAIAKDAVPLISGNLMNFFIVFGCVATLIIILVQTLLHAVFSMTECKNYGVIGCIVRTVFSCILLWVTIIISSYFMIR